MEILQTIEIDAQKVLTLIDTLLPFAEKYIPQVAAIGGPIGLGVSLAGSLLPLLNDIPTGTVITPEIQADRLARIQSIAFLDFSGHQWMQSSTAHPAAVKASPAAPTS